MSIAFEPAALTVAIGGFGAIGRPLASAIISEQLPGYQLVAVAANHLGRAEDALCVMGARSVAVTPLERLAELADVVVECAPAECFERVAKPAVEQGRVLLPMSVGALADRPELIKHAEVTGARIVIPSGAMLGLDALSAVAEGEIHSVNVVTKKPPRALSGSPYLASQGIDVSSLEEPLLVFQGSARSAARAFPASANVTALVGLAGIGTERTTVQVWADPTLSRNTHSVTVSSDSSDFTMQIENRPSLDNPRTGKITAQSVIATLRKHAGHLVVGT